MELTVELTKDDAGQHIIKWSDGRRPAVVSDAALGIHGWLKESRPGWVSVEWSPHESYADAYESSPAILLRSVFSLLDVAVVKFREDCIEVLRRDDDYDYAETIRLDYSDPDCIDALDRFLRKRLTASLKHRACNLGLLALGVALALTLPIWGPVVIVIRGIIALANLLD